MRRKFDTYILDELYVENKIGTAINDLRDMRTIDGKIVHNYHNFTKVQRHLDKFYNIKFNLKNDSSLNLEQSRKAAASYRLFKNIYDRKAANYKPYRGNNFSFSPNVKTKPLLLKAVENLLRIK